jgi:RHS repeat-associated protein
MELKDHLGNVSTVLTDRKKATPAVDELPRTYDADVLSYADYYPFGMEIAHRSESKEHMINYQYQSATLTDFDNPIFTTVSFHEDFTKIANRESNRYVETYNRKYHTRGNPSSGVDRCYYGTGYFEGWTQHMPFSNIPWHELSGTDPADLHNRKLLKYTDECTLPHHGQSDYYSNIWFNNTDVLLIRNWTMYTDETEAILYLGEQNDIGGYDGDGITPGYYEISISMNLNWQNIDINSLDVWYESEDPNVNPVVHATIDFGNATNGNTPATLNIKINQHFKKDALHFYFRDNRQNGRLIIRDLYYNIKRFTRYPTYEATIGNYQTAENTGYRYGFNGMEKDDELKGSGNAIDFGARMYSTRLGRWMSTDPKFGLQPGWSPYKFGLDNPIIFIDPEGETEFYFRGKWVGTDGKDNGLVGIVRNKDVKKSIVKSTKQGLNYNLDGIQHGSSTGGVFGIHGDVLKEANSTLGNAMSSGQNKEFWSVMKSDGDGFSTTHSGVGKEGSGQADGFPTNIQSDVSIHSHPTGTKLKEGVMGTSVESYPADQASPDDENSTFPNFDMNIIVGKQGKAGYTTDPNGNVQVNDTRSSGINVFDSQGNKQISISGSDASNMTSGDRGRLGKKFEKKQNP